MTNPPAVHETEDELRAPEDSELSEAVLLAEVLSRLSTAIQTIPTSSTAPKKFRTTLAVVPDGTVADMIAAWLSVKLLVVNA